MAETASKAPRPSGSVPRPSKSGIPPAPEVDLSATNSPETAVIKNPPSVPIEASTDPQPTPPEFMPTMPTVGDRIGKYVVDRVVGQGGMGIVVAARHEALNELVAIKLLRPKGQADRVHAERFAREARAIIKIKSEHVVSVLDAGTLDTGAPFIVMEYMRGRDLGQIIRAEGPLDVQRAADVMLQVCEAVASAHAVGVIHRDLKPSNFFLTARHDGTSLVKVLDFGISKAIGQEGVVDPNLTETQAVFGSPTYMSPEQIRSAKHVDLRSDIWSLGVAFYEILTRKLPFQADNVAGLLASVIADEPVPPRQHKPDLPEALEELILDCLAKDVRKRVQAVTDLAFRIAPFASPNAETHTLIERIERLGRNATTNTSTTGPKLPVPARPSGRVPPPSSSQSISAAIEARSSGVAFGSTGMDLSTEAPRETGRKGFVAAIGIGVGLAILVAVGGFEAYQLGTRRAATSTASAAPPPAVTATATATATQSAAAAAAASSAPPAPPAESAPAVKPAANTAPAPAPQGRKPIVGRPGAAKPGGQPASPAVTPAQPAPAPAPAPPPKPVDPTSDRY